MKCITYILIGIFSISIGMAQPYSSQNEQQQALAIKQLPPITIYGKLIDQLSGKSIEAASLQIFPAGSGKKGKLIDGMLSQRNGEFRFENIDIRDSILLIISAPGYITKEITIQQDAKAPRFGATEKDLGNIALELDIKQLGEVVVSSSRPALVMGIDRKIFNVDKSLVSTGGTAIDIMKNIPSVTIDIEGNVELRNSSPQIFVDGRPTILTLDQIPADNIDRIELITNPSAKFDASSSGGIINVVLKKNKRIGMNGLASLSVGIPEVFSPNLNLNLREGKLNFFLSAGINQSGGIAKGNALRQNKKNGSVTDYFNQYSASERKRNFKSLRFGTDFFMNNRNTFSVSQNFVTGKFGNDEIQDQEFLDINKQLVRYGTRTSDGYFDFDRNSTRLNYKYNFPKDGQELTADVTYNYGGRTSHSDIINLFFNPNGTEYQPASIVYNDGSSNEKEWTFQTDYVNPLTKERKIESGLRSNQTRFASTYDAFTIKNGIAEKLPLSNNYAYTEQVNAGYITYSVKKEKFSYQLGLRAEHARFEGELLDSALKFGYEYPNKLNRLWDALFPSMFFTRKINDEGDELQVNYSRRIRRGRFWQLNPFIDINDPANLRQGNPQLKPEFINSFELNYSKNYKSGNLLAVLYWRNNPNDITQYSDTITAAQFQQLNNAAIEPNAILNTYINASTANRYGAEFTLQHKVGKNLEITPTMNLMYRTIKANVNKLDLSNEGFNWEAKLISNYKIATKESSFFNNLSFQVIGDYESPEVIPQGKRKAQIDVDFAMRKDFLKNKKGNLTFSINDVFNSRRWGVIYDTERFYQDSFRRWRVRTFRIAFTYKFGDPKFSLRRGNRGSGDGGGEDVEF